MTPKMRGKTPMTPTCEAIQMNRDQTVQWSKKWQVPSTLINVVVQLGARKFNYTYITGGRPLLAMTELDLGITASSDLKPTKQ